MAPLKDPVDGKDNRDLEEMQKAFDISNLKMSDFKAVSLKDARPSHPFDGYPEKKIQVGTYLEKGKEKPLMVNLSHIVVYRGEVKQDPSGKNVTLGYPEMRDKSGKVIRPSTERTGDIASAYNIRAKSYEDRGVDVDCVFDRTIRLADGEMNQCCFIPSPSVRAQILFEYDSKTGKVLPRGGKNPLFLLADPDQFSRLRKIYEMIINPRIRLEEGIRKSFDESVDTTSSTSLPGIPTGE